MSINFHGGDCQESPRTDSEFGICDEGNARKAYSDVNYPEKWMAKVENPSNLETTFTAIDYCIELKRPDGSMDNRCDGMLTYSDNIIFIELKDQQARWISHAVDQLETTIQYYIAHHDINKFKHKRAYAANRAHPKFQRSTLELSQKFFSKYRIRLIIQANIKIC
ncbi:hypothetical protein [Chitinophaga sancti]|uniref:hypothetical protein n=1 Tax=Chitinophaga sancti TaxID=1004 RepID=UPI003F79D699